MSRTTLIHAKTSAKLEADACLGFHSDEPSVLFEWDNDPVGQVPIKQGEWYWIVYGDDSVQAEFRRKTTRSGAFHNKHRLNFRR